MNTRTAAVTFAILTGCYVAALVWLESRRDLDGLGQLAMAVPVMLTLAAVGWVARATRWLWLLGRAGHRPPVAPAALAYVAGFAFTATPGKIGELVRMRYFGSLGVPPWRVLSAFVYERACDLLIVLLLASMAFGQSTLLRTALFFVAAVVLSTALFAWRPGLLTHFATRLSLIGWPRLGRLFRMLRDGLAGCSIWMTPLDLLVSVVLALCAWGTTSLALVWLLHATGHPLPLGISLSIYPLAMLVGAASMLPGGVGTTEGTIITILVSHEVPWRAAAACALGVRLATLWFAVAAGLLAAARLEYRLTRALPPAAQARSTT